ncbi:hypothetical protein [Streptomyces sp. NPDC002088]|uniref:hypothetical protein n=1 Tax=Streptomyces sp. NPDC002088 TaxID=3154665 RepID=UPI003323BC7F
MSVNDVGPPQRLQRSSGLASQVSQSVQRHSAMRPSRVASQNPALSVSISGGAGTGPVRSGSS